MGICDVTVFLETIYQMVLKTIHFTLRCKFKVKSYPSQAPDHEIKLRALYKWKPCSRFCETQRWMMNKLNSSRQPKSILATMNFQVNMTARSSDDQTCCSVLPPNFSPSHYIIFTSLTTSLSHYVVFTSLLRSQKPLSPSNFLFCPKRRFTGNSHRQYSERKT